MNAYQEFLAKKRLTARVSGLTHIPELHAAMSGDHQHQHDVTAWALKLGKAAAFLGTGMGKTLIELEWARVIAEEEQASVLILVPLCVAHQTVREAARFGIDAHYCPDASAITPGVNITNYERLDHFAEVDFAGVVLDESSILKAFDGSTRTALIERFARTPYRLCATATPAPNDYMELGNHSEFLGVMTRAEMLAMFFVHDGGDTQKWRLKGHARTEFWKWVCTWAVSMRKPSDIGYDDGRFILPPLTMHERTVDVSSPTDGYLFALPAQTLQERISARRESVDERVGVCAWEVNRQTDQRYEAVEQSWRYSVEPVCGHWLRGLRGTHNGPQVHRQRTQTVVLWAGQPQSRRGTERELRAIRHVCGGARGIRLTL